MTNPRCCPTIIWQTLEPSARAFLWRRLISTEQHCHSPKCSNQLYFLYDSVTRFSSFLKPTSESKTLCNFTLICVRVVCCRIVPRSDGHVSVYLTPHTTLNSYSTWLLSQDNVSFGEAGRPSPGVAYSPCFCPVAVVELTGADSTWGRRSGANRL